TYDTPCIRPLVTEHGTPLMLNLTSFPGCCQNGNRIFTSTLIIQISAEPQGRERVSNCLRDFSLINGCATEKSLREPHATLTYQHSPELTGLDSAGNQAIRLKANGIDGLIQYPWVKNLLRRQLLRRQVQSSFQTST